MSSETMFGKPFNSKYVVLRVHLCTGTTEEITLPIDKAEALMNALAAPAAVIDFDHRDGIRPFVLRGIVGAIFVNFK